MVRAVLVGWADNDWRLYRQPQWMAEVRRSPEASSLPRRHFDVEETAFRQAVEAWEVERAGSTLSNSIALLERLGATEISLP